MSLTAPADAQKKRLFCEVCQGGGAYGKAPVARPLALSFLLLPAPPFYPCVSVCSARHSLTAGA
ncbi:hypothetical protein C5824_21580 [Salmonella enterica]|nr:hypothetical protein [Salmonella enterica]